MKILDATFAKDFSQENFTIEFTKSYDKLKRLIDDRELEVSVKVISIRNNPESLFDESQEPFSMANNTLGSPFKFNLDLGADKSYMNRRVNPQ